METSGPSNAPAMFGKPMWLMKSKEKSKSWGAVGKMGQTTISILYNLNKITIL